MRDKKKKEDYLFGLRERINVLEQGIDAFSGEIAEERAERKEQDATILEKLSNQAVEQAKEMGEIQKSTMESRKSYQERVRYLEQVLQDSSDKHARDLADEHA